MTDCPAFSEYSPHTQGYLTHFNLTWCLSEENSKICRAHGKGCFVIAIFVLQSACTMFVLLIGMVKYDCQIQKTLMESLNWNEQHDTVWTDKQCWFLHLPCHITAIYGPKLYTASCSPWWSWLFCQFTAYFTMWSGLILCLWMFHLSTNFCPCTLRMINDFNFVCSTHIC